MNEIFKLVENTEEQVVIQNLIKTPLEVARFPFLSAKMEYITVTKGKMHILTITFIDGTTYSFHWGQGSSSVIDECTKRLRDEVINFIVYNCHILYDVKNTKIPVEARVFFNKSFNKWQACMTFKNGDESNYYSNAANDESEMLNEIKVFNPEFSSLKKGVAETGIDIWDVVK